MDLDLTIAMSEYDHVRDLLSGKVQVSGVQLRHLPLDVEEIFYRFLRFQEWDVSEFSMGKYLAVRSQGHEGFKAIPVFPSRMFRQSGFFVRRDSKLRDARELRGKRVGIPTWTQTAQVYARAFLQYDCDVHFADVEWHQSGVNEPGREENLSLELPGEISLVRHTDKSLNQLLLDGEIDAIITAHPPQGFDPVGDSPVRYLLEDPESAESDYFDRTGVFPIMHVIVISQRILEAHPWVAMNLYTAFEEAKDRSIARITGRTASRFPVPWLAEHMARVTAQFGQDPFSYGIEPNRTTLENFAKWAHEQHVTVRPMKVEELFVDEVQAKFKI